MTIEEARQKLEQAYLAAGFAAMSGNKATIHAAYEAFQARTCDAMLAVLDEAENIPTGRHGDVEAEALRTRIKEPVKAEGG